MRIGRLLEAADAKPSTTKGLTEFVEATADFDDLSLKAFVKLAETGRTPPAPKLPSPKQANVKDDPVVVAAEIKDLYEPAGDPNVSEEQVQAACARLEAFPKAALGKLSDELGLVGMKAKKKDEIVSGITGWLMHRKGAAIPRQLIDRPKAPEYPSASTSGNEVLPT